MTLRSSDPKADIQPEEFEAELWWDDADEAHTFYEHGQWWLRATFDNEDQPERTWSIVDAVSATTGDDYLDLEEL